VTDRRSDGNTRQSALDEIADVGCVRRVDDLHRHEPRVIDTVEETLAPAEQDGRDVEHEFVQRARSECLTNGRGAARDVDIPITGSELGAIQRRCESVGDEVERRAPSISIGWCA
jgi:hypothetical protein